MWVCVLRRRVGRAIAIGARRLGELGGVGWMRFAVLKDMLRILFRDRIVEKCDFVL